ncbi:hypothetical protein [Paraburkholderia tropica]|uniref:hypothetical protein n=1 Tax=Paraburkholderia tropica TaxID=92647 RepID=UPI002AB6F9B7|nr:hypothetical protein [Paraburkholderia tropica]
MVKRYLELKTPELRRLAFHELVSRVRRCEPVDGLTEASRAVLNDRRLDLLAGKLVSGQGVQIFFNIDAFNFVSEGIEAQWWEEVMLQYFVQNQASVPMIRAMFPRVGRAEIERTRERLAAPPPGKAAMPDPVKCAHVIDTWNALSRRPMDARECYYQLHQRFSHYTLTTLYALVNLQRG